jgi:hypothetical protein
VTLSAARPRRFRRLGVETPLVAFSREAGPGLPAKGRLLFDGRRNEIIDSPSALRYTDRYRKERGALSVKPSHRTCLLALPRRIPTAQGLRFELGTPRFLIYGKVAP